MFAIGFHIGQKIKDIGANEIHSARKPVQLRISARFLDCIRRNINGSDMLCTCSGGVQCECARMRETIENRFAGSNLCSGTTVIFLVKEKARFLSVDNVDFVFDAVFFNHYQSAVRCGRQEITADKALVLSQTFLFAYGDIVSFANGPNINAELFEYFNKQRKQAGFKHFGAEGENLKNKNISEAVHRQPGKTVGLTENNSTAVKIVSHDRLAVLKRVTNSPAEKVIVKPVVCIA